MHIIFLKITSNDRIKMNRMGRDLAFRNFVNF